MSEDTKKNKGFPWLAVLITAIIVVGGCLTIYFELKDKKKKEPTNALLEIGSSVAKPKVNKANIKAQEILREANQLAELLRRFPPKCKFFHKGESPNEIAEKLKGLWNQYYKVTDYKYSKKKSFPFTQEIHIHERAQEAHLRIAYDCLQELRRGKLVYPVISKLAGIDSKRPPWYVELIYPETADNVRLIKENMATAGKRIVYWGKKPDLSWIGTTEEELKERSKKLPLPVLKKIRLMQVRFMKAGTKTEREGKK